MKPANDQLHADAASPRLEPELVIRQGVVSFEVVTDAVGNNLQQDPAGVKGKRHPRVVVAAGSILPLVK